MRTPVFLLLGSIVLAASCSLDRDGIGSFPDDGTGGDADASVGGAGGSGGTGGTTLDSGTDATGGTAGQGGLDAGEDASLDVAPDTTGVEVCSNGIDDNGDGLADCADPTCDAVVVCVPEVPAGWTPSYVHARTAGGAVLSCGALPLGPTFYQNLTAAPQQCSCGCVSPSGGTCSVPQVTLHGPSSCPSGGGAPFIGIGCHPFFAADTSIGSISTQQPTVLTTGTCQISVDASIPGPSWGTEADVCTIPSTSAGCDAGQVCVARPPQGFDEACILRLGDHPCPVAGYAAKELYHGSYSDTRACSVAGCACGLVTGAICEGTVDVYSEQDCSNTIRSFELDGGCKPANLSTGQAAAVQLSTSGPKGGHCIAVGTGVATGALTPSSPYSVCCGTDG